MPTVQQSSPFYPMPLLVCWRWCGCSSPRHHWPPYFLTACFPPSRSRSPAPVLVLPLPLHPLTFLPCLYGDKVDLSGHLYGEVFLGYEILYGRVSLDDELHVGGVASLATSSSTVPGLLHWQTQPDLHSTVRYVIACDMDFWCYNSQFKLLQHVFWMLQLSI
jgi:hypothetical protein